MFYSHQLLARKAPLGQIWMAATMHAKMNRKKLNKLDIIQICEQILNPSVPMALRLSGILMGGVVIVYERKVKLLYDDVSRLLVEINEAWKVKSAPDRTLLPKGISQAKFDAVTLPENQDTDLGEIEQSMASTNNTFMGFQQTNYFEMKLDNMDGLFMSNNNGRDEAQYDQMHQADVADITINENYESFPTKTSQYESIHLERFDIEGDEEMQFNNHFQESGPAPSSMIPSPPRSPEPQKPEEIPDQHPEEIPDQHPEDQTKKQSDEEKDAVQVQKRPRPTKKARKPATCAMDNDQTVIPGHLYQSWLQNTSKIVSKRGMKRKRGSMFPSTKISTLMDLPPTVLLGGLYSPGSGKIHYPPPLLKLWMRKIQPDCDSPSGKISPTQPPQPSSSSPPSGAPFHDPPEMPYEDGFNGFGSFEKTRRTSHPFTKVNERFLHPVNDDIPVPEIMVTPGNARDEFVIPGSGSDHGLPSLNSGRKRAYSSSRHSGSSLEPVAEDYVVPRSDPKFKLHKVSETGFTPDNDLLVETGPTQTQKPMNDDQPMDQMTNAIRMHFKAYFDLAGSDETESLDQLAIGLNRKRAANLFYQTCVLATREYIRVEQRVAFGDIVISRGAKM